MPRKNIIPRLREPEDLFQRDTRTALESVARSEVGQGVFLADVAIGTTTTRISHTLGRVPKGWKVVDITADSRVFRDATITTERATFLYLKATTAVTVTLWIF